MTTRRPAIHIGNLRQPVLTHAHSQALKRAEASPVELTEASILGEASRQSGFDDFGPPDFRQRLRDSLDTVTKDSRITALGRTLIFEQYVRFAVTRLQFQDVLRRYPEILGIEIRRPIIIIGPPRSGTTYLQGIVAADSRMHSLRLWESHDPIIPPPSSQLNGIDLRFARYISYYRKLVSFIPHLDLMDPAGPNEMAEEVDLQCANFPTNMHSRRDQNAHYEFMKTILKVLQWQRRAANADRWILKSPSHLLHLDALLETFPDATVVMTHRDPVAVVQSVATMGAYKARLLYNEINIDEILDRAASLLEIELRRYMRDRDTILKDRLVDLSFHEFCIDGLAATEQIYAGAGCNLPEDERNRVQRFITEHIYNNRARVSCDLRRDFDTDPDKLASRFSFYYNDVPCPIHTVL